MRTAYFAVTLFLVFSPSVHSGGWLTPHDRTRQAKVLEEARPKAGEFWLGIVGDSSVTGAVTSKAYTANYGQLFWQVVSFLFESQRTVLRAKFDKMTSPQEFHIAEGPAPMTRVLYSQREFAEASAAGETVLLNLGAKASLRLDTPEYAFGYLVGRALDIDPAHIVLAGQDGEVIDSMARQLERLFEVGSSTLPPLVLVSFVANDFCHPANFLRPVSVFRAGYAQDVREEFAKIATMPPAFGPQGTLIVVLAPLDVANLLDNPELLSQEIPFEGRSTITCGELRAGLPLEGDHWTEKMEDIMVSECRGVLGYTADPQARSATVRALQKAQVDVLTEAVDEFNRVARPGLRMRLATSVRDIDFHKGDLAADCFHPGVSGHARIARQLLRNELKDVRRTSN